jgi:hypothetical protein
VKTFTTESGSTYEVSEDGRSARRVEKQDGGWDLPIDHGFVKFYSNTEITKGQRVFFLDGVTTTMISSVTN